MDNRRFALLVALGVIVFLMYQAWQKDNAPKPQAYAPPAIAANAATPDDVPVAGAAAPDNKPANGNAPGATPAALPSDQFLRSAQRIVVTTDKLRAEIDTQGGDLRRVELLGIPVSKQKPDENLHLLNDTLPNFFILQSGLVDAAQTAPSHRTLYRSAASEYHLAEGAASIDVPLQWEDGAGHKVTKIFTFRRGSYEIGLRQQASNTAATPWALNAYVQLWRTPFSETPEPQFIKTFMGAGFYEQKSGSVDYRFHKLDFKEVTKEPLNVQQTGGWTSMLQHYFLAAIIPPAGDVNRFYAKPRAIPDTGLPGYVVGYVGPQQVVNAGATQNFDDKLFVGPKLQDKLAQVAPGLEFTVDYGRLTLIAEPIFWVLAKLHSLVGNWGFSIILLTLIIKLAFYKLSEAQYRSMARMKKFAPRIQALKERFADDREQLHKAMMDLYKKEGFNPLGGCWPMLVQFPVFIALYWVLLQSVELREAPFILWIQDMSAPDPYYVMPALFGISMFVQQKLSGSMATMEEMQQKMMMVMPFMLATFFAFFPAGLVLYWFVSNLIGIGQQWVITRKIENEGSKA